MHVCCVSCFPTMLVEADGDTCCTKRRSSLAPLLYANWRHPCHPVAPVRELLCCPAQLDADVGLQVGLNLCGKQSTNMWKVSFGRICLSN